MVSELEGQMSSAQRVPAVGQEFGDQIVFVRGQTLQHIFQIGRGIVVY